MTAISLNPDLWLETHGDVLYRFAMLRLRSADLAEEAVQETFLAALRGVSTFDGRCTEQTWLVGILRHKIVDLLRRHWRETPASDVSPDAEGDQFLDGMFDDAGHWKPSAMAAWADPRAAAENQDFWRVFRNCLGKMSRRLADLFVLREVENMESDEVCKVFGITSTNYWAMMHRARAKLRACLTLNWFQNPESRTEPHVDVSPSHTSHLREE